MEKKEGFFQRLNQDVKLQAAFCVVSVVVLVIVYLPLSVLLKDNAIQRKAVTEDNYVLVDVAEVRNMEDKLILSGWVMCLNAELKDIKIFLIPMNAGDLNDVVLKSTLNKSSIEQEYIDYLDVENTIGSGFEVEIKKNKIQKEVCYVLLVYVNYEQMNEKAVKLSSQKYLYNEQIYPYNPLEFVEPVFVDEQMKKVVEAGTLLGYTTEHGAWLYQYGDSLFWILDKRMEANLDEELYMFCHMNTSRPELLPEYRSPYGFDNEDFVFKVYELEQTTNSMYRVATRKIEKNYPITYISTGHYSNGENRWVIRNRIGIME